MSVIRLNTSDFFDVDSIEYEVLVDAIIDIKGVPGAVLELGTRRGGSAKLMIDALVENNDTEREFFCIDPYGDLEYECTSYYNAYDQRASNIDFTQFKMMIDEKTTEELKKKIVKRDYGFNNKMKERVVPSLYYLAFQAGLDFQFFFLEDTEFFNRYSDGVPCYDKGIKKLVNQYSLVFIDGPHTNEIVKRQAEFFIPRMSSGGILVFDDYWMYEHEKIIDPILFSAGFEMIEKHLTKISYKKIK